MYFKYLLDVGVTDAICNVVVLRQEIPSWSWNTKDVF